MDDLAKIFEIKAHACADIIQAIKKGKDPEKTFDQYFFTNVEGTYRELICLNNLNNTKSKNAMLDLLTIDGAFKRIVIYELGIAKDSGERSKNTVLDSPFTRFFKQLSSKERGNILTTDGAIMALALTGYKREDFKELFKEQSRIMRGNILAIDGVMRDLSFVDSLGVGANFNKEDFKELLSEQSLNKRKEIARANDAIYAMHQVGFSIDEVMDIFEIKSKKTMMNIINEHSRGAYLMREMGIHDTKAWLTAVDTNNPPAPTDGGELTLEV